MSSHNISLQQARPHSVFEVYAAGGLRVLVLAICLLTTRLGAEVPDLFHFYEEDTEPGYVADSLTSEFRIKLAEGSQISFTQARFGKGSLLISPHEGRSGVAWEKLINSEEWKPFQAEIDKMTITAWVRPSGTEPFIIFWRIPSQTSLPGFFQFTFLGGASNRLYFAATGPGEGEKGTGAQHILMSSLSVTPLTGEWNHFALTFEDGEVRFYLNGELVGEPRFFPLEVIPASENRFPSLKAVAGVGEGSYVDDFGFFGNRALSGDDIRSIYENGLQAFLEKSSPKNSK